MNALINSAFKKQLRGEAQKTPVFLKIGKQGVTPEIIELLQEKMTKAPLVKVAIEGDRKTRSEMTKTLEQALSATLISSIGSSVSFYR